MNPSLSILLTPTEEIKKTIGGVKRNNHDIQCERCGMLRDKNKLRKVKVIRQGESVHKGC
jgi:hypothetical protein